MENTTENLTQAGPKETSDVVQNPTTQDNGAADFSDYPEDQETEQAMMKQIDSVTKLLLNAYDVIQHYKNETSLLQSTISEMKEQLVNELTNNEEEVKDVNPTLELMRKNYQEQMDVLLNQNVDLEQQLKGLQNEKQDLLVDIDLCLGRLGLLQKYADQKQQTEQIVQKKQETLQQQK